MLSTNFLIIGSGVAGLTLAVKLAETFPSKKILVVTKAGEDESNTKYAQGGMAVVLNSETDSFNKHVQDTLIAGDGLCEVDVVKMVVKEGPKRLKELMEWGANFDTDAAGKLTLGKEGGHSESRILHHKDITGYEIERVLLKRIHQLKNITLLSHHFAIDLITEHQAKNTIPPAITCYGAYILNIKNNIIITVKADTTTLASGGIGHVYGHTTNPIVATGDGLAMAYRAKAKIKNMEFVQFHPTALYKEKQEGASFLISEAVRGFGAFLRDANGRRFMPDYDKRAELASRDIVSQSIDTELKKSNAYFVYLDCTHLNTAAFQEHFPNIYENCLQQNIDIAKDWIPVVPASHYSCGGIVVDRHGRSTINNLFACGECSYTGLHGANRLASNSLLEAIVYAHNIYKYHCENNFKTWDIKLPEWIEAGTLPLENKQAIEDILLELQKLMRDYVGIVRSNKRLYVAVIKLDIIYNQVDSLYKKTKLILPLCELRNMVNVSYLIIRQSLERKENRGGYYNIDCDIKKQAMNMISQDSTEEFSLLNPLQ